MGVTQSAADGQCETQTRVPLHGGFACVLANAAAAAAAAAGAGAGAAGVGAAAVVTVALDLEVAEAHHVRQVRVVQRADLLGARPLCSEKGVRLVQY